MEIARSVTLETAVSAKKVFHVKQHLGEENLTSLVVFIIKNFIDNMNVGSNMSDMQIMEVATYFIDNYPHASIEDLILCLKGAQMGKYGTIYNRIDGSVIFSFLARYEDDKAYYLETKHRNMKQETAAQFNDIYKAMPAEIKTTIKQFTFNPAPKPKKYVVTVPDEAAYRENFTNTLSSVTVIELLDARKIYLIKSPSYALLIEEELDRRGVSRETWETILQTVYEKEKGKSEK